MQSVIVSASVVPTKRTNKWLYLYLDRLTQTLIKTQIISPTCDQDETQLKPDSQSVKKRGGRRGEKERKDGGLSDGEEEESPHGKRERGKKRKVRDEDEEGRESLEVEEKCVRARVCE